MVEGKHMPGRSDIDVLIVGGAVPKRAEIWTKILEIGDPFAPFEFHLAAPEEFEGCMLGF